MKRICAVLSAVVLLLSAMALAETGGPESYSETGVEKDVPIQAQFITVSPESPISVPTVFSYTLDWERQAGSFHRVADAYEWDPEALTYTRTQAGYWVTDEEPALRLTLTNRSNTALEVTVEWEAAEGAEVEMHAEGAGDGFICPAAIDTSGTGEAWWQTAGTEQEITRMYGFTVTEGLESIGVSGSTLSGSLGTVTIGIGSPLP